MTRAAGPALQEPGGAVVLLAIGCLTCVGAVGAVIAGAFDPVHEPEYLFWSAVAVLADAMIGFLLVACLLGLQKPGRLGVVLAILVPCAILAGFWAKFVILGTPVTPGDLGLLIDLARAEAPWKVALAVAAVLGLVAALALNIRLRRSTLAASAPVGLVLAVAFAAEISPAVANRVVDGLGVEIGTRIMSHGLRFARGQAQDAVERHEVAALGAWLREASPPARPVPPLDRRSLHVIVVESFQDPLSFPAFPWPTEPLSPLFARWRAAGGPTAISPVFGNASSNAEFEVLCGLPAAVSQSDIVFYRIPTGVRLDCLPAILAAQGFRTQSLVPSDAGFFAAGRAFAAMGFATSAFSGDLDMSDRDGEWLSAESTLAQVRRRVFDAMAADPSTPLFSYTFVNAGHYPYDRNRAARPDRLDPAPADPVVRAWANGAHHNALALEKHAAAIRAADPAALIVMLGDHAPVLGPDFRGYRQGGRLGPGDAALERATMYATPLLILDGDEIVPVGRVPSWQIPGVILDRLSRGAACEAGCAHGTPWRLRPYRDFVLGVEAQGPGEVLCRAGGRDGMAPAACPALLEEARQLRVALMRQLAAPRGP